MNKKQQLFVLIILSILFLFSRLINSNSLPLFSDEAYVIVRAQEIWRTGDWLAMVKLTTQPVLIWLVAFFTKLPLDQVFAGRLVSAIFGLITALLITQTAGKFIHPKAKWIVFLLMMLLPFTFFYDRTLLFESSLLTWMTLAIFIPVVGLPGAILTKQIGWLAVPLAVFLHFRNKRLVFISLVAALVIPFAVWFIALGSWEQIVKINFMQTAIPLGASANFKTNLLRAKLWLISYVTLPILFLALLGLIKESVDSVKKRSLSQILIIGLWSLSVLIFEAKVAVIFYPRYLYPMLLGVVLLATSAAWMLYTLVSGFKKTLLRLTVLFVSPIIILYPSVKFDYTLMNSPLRAPLALEDRLQFFEDWTSGVGSSEFYKEINKFLHNNNDRLTVYVEGENPYYVTLNRGKMQNYEIKIASWLNEPLTEVPQEVFEEKAEVWFVRNRHPDIPDDWPVSLITQVQKSPSRSVYLYRVNK